MYKVVEEVSVTIPVNAHEYIISISLSALGLDDLKHHKWLGIRFPKNKATFIKDLSEVLSIEICEKLIEMEKEPVGDE